MQPFTLITGASSGIGKATAERLAKEGKNLILVARRAGKLETLRKALSSAQVEVRVHALDLTDKDAVEALFAGFEGIAVEAVVNNAGAAYGKDSLETANDEDLQAMIDVNITAFLRVLRLAIPHLRRTQGHMVTIGSIAGIEAYAGGATYSGTKHFVHAATSGLRHDLLGSGIRVTEIAPGAVETEFSVVRFKGDAQKANAVYDGFEPLRPEDIADAIWYALSRPKHVAVAHMLILPTAQASVEKIAKTPR
jgi:NADP-dependent 3-hydroxy acid dehydrogenase YdfG